jgi:ferredoxin--NADP+ reductase
MFERLPTPFGLVRAGVAPDHQKIKSVSRVFEKIASHPEYRYFGNVEIGKHITPAELSNWYHCVIYAVGAQRGKLANISGQELPGNHSAAEFVGWYNGHPDHSNANIDLSHQSAVVIGNGNVALDIARILLTQQHVLAKTDIADHALKELRHSNIEEVTVLGRGTPDRAAFTHPELVELGKLPNVDVIVDPKDLAGAKHRALENCPAHAGANLDTLADYASRPRVQSNHRLIMRFSRTPAEVLGPSRVRGLRFAENRHRPESLRGPQSPPTFETAEAGLIIHAVGHTGTPVFGLPFDEPQGVITNESGRIVDNGRRMTGSYVTGWIKRGPRGVIGTNKQCAQQTIDALLADLRDGTFTGKTAKEPDTVRRLVIERCDTIDFDAWQRIDSYEQACGRRQGRLRTKLTDVAHMVKIGLPR